MALLDSKQLNPSLTGSFILSGSTQTFIGRSDFQGSITASGDISASGTVFADNFQSTGGDSDGISFTDDLNLSGNFTASGDISGSGNIFGTGNLDIDGTSNLEGDVTLQNDLSVTGNITGSNFSGSYVSTGSFGSIHVAGNAGFREYIYHNGDRDTFIRLQPDEINIEAGGENMIFIVEGGGGDQADKVTINNLLADVDFQVKGGTDANLFRTDASNDRVGIGVQSPTEFLHISGSGTTKLFVEGDISGSYLGTGSFGRLEIVGNANVDGTSNFAGNVTMQNDLVVTGRIDAEEIHTTFISSSITQATGSNIFGDEQTDIHQFTGSLNQTGSVSLTGGSHSITSAGTIDLDAEGALTLDGGSITVGGDTDVAVDIDSTTLDIDASGAITIDGTSTVAIAGASTSTYGDDTAVWSFNGSGAVSETGMTTFSLTPSSTVDIDAGGAVTIDGTSITIGGDDSGVAVSIGHSTSETTIGDDLTVTGDITGSSNLEIAGNVSSSATSTGSFGYGFIDKLGVNSKSPIQTLQVAGTVGVANYIYHNNDLNTYLRFEDEKVTLANDDDSIVLEGNVTASGNISGSYLGTGSFGRIDSTVHVATTVETQTLACFDIISGSGVSTGSFGRVVVDNGISDNFIIDDGKVSGSFTTTGSFGRLEIGGNATIGGDITLGGDITIGDAAGDSISFEAEISSSLIPDADSTYDIGSSSKNWRFGYIEQLSATHITASANISASGNLSVTGNLDIDGTANIAGDTTFQSNVTASGNLSGSQSSSGSFGYISVDGIDISSLGTSDISAFSSSIATQLNTLSADVIALSIALG